MPDAPPARDSRAVEDSADLRLYRTRYKGVTRGQLAQRDRALYYRLRRAGLLYCIPLKHRPRRAIPDPLGYYREHYQGVRRGQLSKRDFTLYLRLRGAGLLAHVPLVRPPIPDLLGYYHRHYKGLSRWELFRRDSGLYHRIRRAGLLDKIPRKPRKKRVAQGHPDKAQADDMARHRRVEPRLLDEKRDGEVP
jgi:hypothetical protein